MDQHPPTDWHSVGHSHRRLAEIDPLEIRPTLIGHVGERRLVLVELRAFPKGRYQEPIIEALTVPISLGCDRISLAMPARAWSMEDPVPPVAGRDDVRQRVLAETRVVDANGSIETTSVLHPFEVVAGSISWSDAVVMPPAEGWITSTLGEVMRQRSGLAVEIRPVESLERAELLGHQIAFDDRAADLFVVGVAAAP